MTACVNKKSKRVAAVVTASLVGALSIGAPAIALADTSVSLLSQDQDSAIQSGKATQYKIGNVYKTVDGKVTVSASTAAKHKLEITKVMPDGAGMDEVTLDTSVSTTVFFKKATKAEIAAGTGIATINGVDYVAAGTYTTSMPTTPGDYVAVVNHNVAGGFIGKDVKAPMVEFKVVADDLDGSYLAKDDGATEFSFDGDTVWNSLKLKKADGTDFEATEADWDVFAKNDDKTSVKDSLMEAGTYVVVVTGKGAYATQSLRLEVEVGKLDLSTADLYLEDVVLGDLAPTFSSTSSSIKGADAAALTAKNTADAFSFDIVGNTWGADGAGTYTYKLSIKDNEEGKKAAANMEGSATLKFFRVNKDASRVAWNYNGNPYDFSDNKGVIIVDRSVDEDSYDGTWTFKELDFSKFTGTYLNAENKKTKLTSDQFSWTIVDNATKKTVSDLSKKGSYTVILEADSSKLGYDVLRTRSTFQVTVKQGTIGEADTTFSYDGKAVTKLDGLVYDGKDFLSRIGIQVKDSKGNLLAAGKDYEVTVKKDGKVVNEIVDAGKYKVIVSSDLYVLDGKIDGVEELDVTVNPISVGQVQVDTASTPFKTFYNGHVATNDVKVDSTAIPYTGSAIANPVVTYTDADGETQVLPESVYTISYKYSEKGSAHTDAKAVVVDQMSKAGSYTAFVSLKDGVTNYEFSSDPVETGWNELKVVKDMETGFLDNADEEWYSESVNKAKVLGYVNGASGTNFFNPTLSIKRGDVVCILFNMAGGSSKFEGVGNEVEGYETGFSDVDKNLYYAKAIQWASKYGVVNGYGDGTFAPEKIVTREEFACMLANYAEMKGDFSSVDADKVLSGYADGSSVHDWAEKAVAWAVDSKIMGKGGAINPGKDISRGEVAAMAVDYQPQSKVFENAK